MLRKDFRLKMGQKTFASEETENTYNQRKWQEIGKIVAAFRLIAAFSFCISSLQLQTLSGVFKLLRRTRNRRPSMARRVCPISFERETHYDCWDRHGRTTSQIREILLGEAATLTASALPDDTCAAWSKQPNEEADPKENPCAEDSAPAPSEAQYQAS